MITFMDAFDRIMFMYNGPGMLNLGNMERNSFWKNGTRK